MIDFPVNTESTHDKSRHAKNILDRIVTFLYVIGQPISQAEKSNQYQNV
ncbi:hypothetical protein predicted by Glimmer/Critica [Streptococcus dysgalactiae subsp. equisimilis AC-2713]|uniref:Uncharacterized protein n=1 Tax=Streptococcus dysgalactiae subsp. equisimilis AC-2713 TaxID=759913 RepID=A0AB33R884_STREQ|nr:hypothetical protein predicted by Glimmer/Critica [Streptococcus dysgalactiae subsp. equisimilis AC-2713]